MKNINNILGGLGRVSKLPRRLAGMVAEALGPEPEWMKKKWRVDREFDEKFGVSTGGITQLKRLHLAGSREDAAPHIAADPDEFSAALGALGADFSQYTFVDLGAGKGRALLLAAAYGFKEIVGVEFARELVEVAQRNIRAARAPDSPPISILEQDATTYELPDGPIVLFMYNPFAGKTMETVARRTRESLERNPRPLHVLYLNPFHLEGWVDAGFSVDRREHFAILTPLTLATSAHTHYANLASGLPIAARPAGSVSCE
jgi:SAM-dependent methyltransferase